MVGGRMISGEETCQEDLRELAKRKKLEELKINELRAISDYAQEAFNRGDYFRFAELNYRLMAEINPRFRTKEVYEMTIKYFTGLNNTQLNQPEEQA